MNFLQDFNTAINNVNKEIENDKYMQDANFCQFIKDSMDMICTRTSYINEVPIKQLSVIQEDKMFETISDFFKSIDNEFYDKSSKILDNKYPNTKVYIYDFHKDDPNNLTHYYVHYSSQKTKVFLPLRYSLTQEDANKIDYEYGEDFCTIDDLYSIVHEISHLFDINPEDFADTPTLTRDILTEVTPGIFENFLSSYLLKNGIFNPDSIINKKARTNNKLVTHANVARIKLLFSQIQKSKGTITEIDIKDVSKTENLNNTEFKNILYLITYSNISIIENKRYALCAMYSPMIFEKCRTHSGKTVELLKKYLNETSDNLPFADILKGVGIDIKQDINKYKCEEKDNQIDR